jgi:hypothetical protein
VTIFLLARTNSARKDRDRRKNFDMGTLTDLHASCVVEYEHIFWNVVSTYVRLAGASSFSRISVMFGIKS